MMNREDWHMIQEMKEKGCYNRDIAVAVGCCEKTVSRALQRGGPPAKRKPGLRPSKLDGYHEEIDRLLQEEVWNAEVIFVHLKQLGYAGGKTIVRMYVHPRRVLRRQKGTVRYETDPGRQLQHDWGEIVREVGGEMRKIYFSVNTLGYSRRFHVFAAEKNDAEHTYEGIQRSFAWFGGVPAEVLVDNQKAAVLEHRHGERPRFNPRFIDFAEHHGFRPKACQGGRPQTKGKDERMVGYVKSNFFLLYRQFESMAHVNQLLEQWLLEVADQRFHGTVKEVVAERFTRERERLAILPQTAFDTSYRLTRVVALDGYIDVRGNRYSVPCHLCGMTVPIRLSLDGELRVFDHHEQLVARHRLRDKGWSTIAEHHARLWQQVFPVMTRDLQVYEEAGSWS